MILTAAQSCEDPWPSVAIVAAIAAMIYGIVWVVRRHG